MMMMMIMYTNVVASVVLIDDHRARMMDWQTDRRTDIIRINTDVVFGRLDGRWWVYLVSPPNFQKGISFMSPPPPSAAPMRPQPYTYVPLG